MRVCTLGYLLMCGLFWGSSAMSQELPRLDIEATCKAAQPLIPQDRNPYESCMRDETSAERQLQGIWSSTAAGQRDTCAQEAQIGGTPSYVDMLTCLQVAQGTTPTAPPRRRRAPN
jgi:hypothetical protein